MEAILDPIIFKNVESLQTIKKSLFLKYSHLKQRSPKKLGITRRFDESDHNSYQLIITYLGRSPTKTTNEQRGRVTRSNNQANRATLLASTTTQHSMGNKHPTTLPFVSHFDALNGLIFCSANSSGSLPKKPKILSQFRVPFESN